MIRHQPGSIRLISLRHINIYNTALLCKSSTPNLTVKCILTFHTIHTMSSQKETEPHVQEESSPQCPDTPNVPYSHPNDDRRDEALDFLEKYKNAAALGLSRDAAFTRGLRKKIDFRVLPFLWLCYTLCFIDKVLLNVRESRCNEIPKSFTHTHTHTHFG